MAAFGACALFGAVRKARTKQEVFALSGITADIREAERMVGLSKAPIASIAGELARSGRSAPFWQSVSDKLNGGSALIEAYSASPAPTALPEAAQVLDGLFSSLGRGDAETESKRLRAAAERLEEILGAAEKRASEKCRLTGSLSMLAGAAAALLLL